MRFELGVSGSNTAVTSHALLSGVGSDDHHAPTNVVMGVFSREFGAGTQEIACSGITPEYVFFMFDRGGTGWDDGTTSWCILENHSGAEVRETTSSLKYFIDAGNYTNATVTSLDEDSFELTWAVTGSPLGSWSCRFWAIG